VQTYHWMSLTVFQVSDVSSYSSRDLIVHVNRICSVTVSMSVCVCERAKELYVVLSVDNRSSSIMHTVRDLQPGRAYQFVVTAENEAGEGPPSHPSSVLTIPEECLYLILFDFSTYHYYTAAY